MALTSTPGLLDSFASSTHNALVNAFTRPVTPGVNATSVTEIYIRTTFASAWPDATQGIRLIHMVHCHAYHNIHEALPTNGRHEMPLHGLPLLWVSLVSRSLPSLT